MWTRRLLAAVALAALAAARAAALPRPLMM
jgi:hypothetical protein